MCVISDRMDERQTFLLHFCYKNVLKYDLITCNSLQNIKITQEMDSPYSNKPKTWCHSWLYYFWFSSYDSGLIRRGPSWICPIWPPPWEPSLAPSRNWLVMVISTPGPKLVLVGRFEHLRCF